MHCNLRSPEPRQPFPALITTPCQVWSRYPLPYYSVFAADTVLYAVTLTFDLEHLQRITCDVMKLCTKFERNRAIRGGVIAISVFDLMTVNIALRVALGSGIIFTKFDLRQLIRASIIAFLCWYVVTLWSRPLTHWPWTFVVHQTSCDQSLYEIWVKSSNPRLNYG